MTRHSLIPKMSTSPRLEQVMGPGGSQVFELSYDRITVGRNDNNDIVLQSEAVSRHHAVFEREEGQYVVRDNDSKNGIQVNGVLVKEHILSDHDLVAIGNFAFRYIEGTGPSEQEIRDEAHALQNPVEHSVYPGEVGGLPSATKIKGPRSKRPLIYGAVGLLLVYAYFSSQPEKKEVKPPSDSDVPIGEAPKTEPKFEPALDPNAKVPGLKDPLMTRAEHEIDGLEVGATPQRQAEQSFRKGQREYLNKNFHRAIEDFRSALQLNRSHELADYYLRMSVFEVEAQARQNMEIGRKYFESMQYQRAMYHFQQVISDMQHRPADKMITDAEKFIALSKRRLQAAEQLP